MAQPGRAAKGVEVVRRVAVCGGAMSRAASLHRKRHAELLWRGFSVFESIGDDAEREGLDGGERELARLAVRHHAGQVGDFRYPAAVGFAVELNCETQGHVQPHGSTGPRPAQVRWSCPSPVFDWGHDDEE